MSVMAVPAFYDSLALSFVKAWDLIEPGATIRRSSAHTPVVATVDARGDPQLRVMVLRQGNRDTRRLRFHTDLRAAKVKEIGNGSGVSVLMYDPDQKLQLRLVGHASIETDGSDAEAAWQHSTTFARRCYMGENPPAAVSEHPTSGLPNWIEGKQPNEADLIDSRANFAILWVDVQSVEWLYLANNGHRRAKWEWDGTKNDWSGCWLVP